MSLQTYLGRVRNGDILESMLLHNFEDLGTGVYYIGYQSMSGAWVIQKYDNGTMTYVFGADAYATAWTGRATLTYSSVLP